MDPGSSKHPSKQKGLNHHMNVVKMNLKLKNHWKTGVQRFPQHTDKLNQFKITLKKMFQDLLKKEPTMEEICMAL